MRRILGNLTILLLGSMLITVGVHVAEAQMKGHSQMKMKMEMSGKIFEGVGRVVAVNAKKGQLVVDHEKIEGFMDAMTMGYPVLPVKLLSLVKPGDKIRFKIDGNKKAIVELTTIRE